MIDNKISAPPLCPECKQMGWLVKKANFYNKPSCKGHIWVCYKCDTRVGCHEGTYKPLGHMAGESLRKTRVKIHFKFDERWNGAHDRSKARDEAYAWLGKTLGLSKEKAHIGMLNMAQCKQLLDKLEEI